MRNAWDARLGGAAGSRSQAVHLGDAGRKSSDEPHLRTAQKSSAEVRLVADAGDASEKGRRMKKSFKVALVRDGSMCFIPVPFDPRAIFGKVRAPVRVTLNGYTYRSTIASMGEGPCVPLRRSNREAAALEGNETLSVTLELDAEKRKIEPPRDFARALKAKPPAWERWRALSYSQQREYVEALETAKKRETRARRLHSAVEAIAAIQPKPSPRRAAALASTSAPKQPVETPRLNAAWHQGHRMPKAATTAQRLAWHLAHQKNCGCRPMPAKLRALAVLESKSRNTSRRAHSM